MFKRLPLFPLFLVVLCAAGCTLKDPAKLGENCSKLGDGNISYLVDKSTGDMIRIESVQPSGDTLDERISVILEYNSCPEDYVCDIDSEDQLYCHEKCTRQGESYCMGKCVNYASLHIDFCNNSRMICKPGFYDCDNNFETGCENEGECDSCPSGQARCGTECVNLTAGHVERCDESGKITCSHGYSDCNQNISDGCEINILGKDADNCGSCGNPCQSDAPFCVNGHCELSCPEESSKCGTSCLNLSSNHIDSCDAQTGDLTCVDGYADCDGKSGNGCEINVKGNNPGHCGKCDAACPPDKPFCENGNCILSCSSGMTKCGETCLSLSVNHVSSCDEGTGELTCAEGYANCDSIIDNGCEIQINGSDASNCGACGHSCNPGEDCTNGECKSKCGRGTKNCGGICLDLTEVNASDCSLTTGKLTCLPGYSDCDGVFSNGCESNNFTSKHNCGGCADTVGNDCTNIPNATGSGKCENGRCKIPGCTNGSYLSVDESECIGPLTCGTNKCYDKGEWQGVRKGHCDGSKCIPDECTEGFVMGFKSDVDRKGCYPIKWSCVDHCMKYTGQDGYYCSYLARNCLNARTNDNCYNYNTPNHFCEDDNSVICLDEEMCVDAGPVDCFYDGWDAVISDSDDYACSD